MINALNFARLEYEKRNAEKEKKEALVYKLVCEMNKSESTNSDEFKPVNLTI